jgi:hypothetical protein
MSLVGGDDVDDPAAAVDPDDDRNGLLQWGKSGDCGHRENGDGRRHCGDDPGDLGRSLRPACAVELPALGLAQVVLKSGVPVH